jgi:hypothetical protein
MTLGRSSRAAAIAAPGKVLSQPTRNSTASSEWPRTASSALSAMHSRLISEAFIPLVPMEMPSVTTIVLKSTGVPPASSIPRRACSARPRKWMLQGVTLDQVLTIATIGFAIAASS